MEEKNRSLENKLEIVKKALRDSESENIQLKDQLKEMTISEEKLNVHLKTLQANLEIISSKQKELETINDNLISQLQDAEEQNLELESRLSESSSLLEEERAKQERRAKATQETSLELKGLMQRSHSRVEDSNKRVNEFEKLLQAEKSRISEFEQEIETLEEKVANAENEKQKYADKVSELNAELDKSRLAETSLKNTLDGKAEKEKDLKESLNTTKGKLESIENESDQKLREVLDSFTFADSDMKSLYEKLELLKDQIKGYQDQAKEGSGKSAALKEDLGQTTRKVGELENSNEQLKKQKEKAENKASQSILDNELLLQTNAQLKEKVYELQQLLDNGGVKDVSKLKNIQEELSSTLNEAQDSSERDKIQSELSSIKEQKQHVEEQLKEYREMNETLKDDLEKLTLEEAQNFASRARAKELEEKLKAIEADMSKEVESVRKSATEREADLTSRLEKVQQLEHESASAQDTITVLEKEKNDSKQAFEELEAKNQLVEHLEKELKELQKKLQEDKTVKAPGSRSRFKLVIGVALVSIILGLVLNGNY